MGRGIKSDRKAVKFGTPPQATEPISSCFFARTSALETIYSHSAFTDPFLGECDKATSYTLLYTGATQAPVVRPKLPLGLENLLVAWRHGTGEIAEGPTYTKIFLSLIEPAEFGTRYDFVTSVEVPSEPADRTPIRTAWLVEARVNPAEELRELTSLPVEELAEIFGVSRVTYYNWIADRPIAFENERRLYGVVKLLKQVCDARRYGSAELKRWLLTPFGAEGWTPLKVLGAGEDDTLRALALRAVRPPAWTPLVSESAIRESGVPRSSMRRVGSRGWRPASKMPSLEDRLEALKPSAILEPEDVDDRDPNLIEEGRGLYSP